MKNYLTDFTVLRSISDEDNFVIKHVFREWTNGIGYIYRNHVENAGDNSFDRWRIRVCFEL